MPQVNVLWTGREYYSLENCLVNMTDKGADIRSTIVGSYEDKLYLVEYTIGTNQRWETTFLEVKSRHSDQVTQLQLEGDGQGNWRSNDLDTGAFKGCIDVDITLTPFTNTLPIRRLALQPGDRQEIQVIYLNLLAQQIVPLRQKYNCLSASSYRYENIPNDFEAVIEVDEDGLVIDYPSLFVRTRRLDSAY